jgi:predicted NBD/HSP70 family sugar kinase
MTTFNEPSYPVGEHISKALDLPVTIENDSTCLARAEQWFGAAKSLDDFSLFHFGMWLDTAQYAGGLPRVGGNGLNSEIAHVKTGGPRSTRVCLCGKTGCAATFASIFGLLLGAGVQIGLEFTTQADLLPQYQELAASALAGDGQSEALFAEAGEHLGLIVANHINSYDPANVLVLMSDLALIDLLRPSFERALNANVLASLHDRTKISISLPTPEWRWKGAAAHALEQTYLNPNIKVV